jgi:hypothetical protein
LTEKRHQQWQFQRKSFDTTALKSKSMSFPDKAQALKHHIVYSAVESFHGVRNEASAMTIPTQKF